MNGRPRHAQDDEVVDGLDVLGERVKVAQRNEGLVHGHDRGLELSSDDRVLGREHPVDRKAVDRKAVLDDEA